MTKGTRLQQIWDNLPKERQQRIEAMAQQLEVEYLTLQELRQAAGLTQHQVSVELDMPQSNVSRLEKRSDMLLSTLRKYVEAVGGKLNLIVELPNHQPIFLDSLGDLIESQENVPGHRGEQIP